MLDIFDIEKVKKLCEFYDESRGQYPETEFEGLSVFNFIVKELGMNKEYRPIFDYENYDVKNMRYLEED